MYENYFSVVMYPEAMIHDEVVSNFASHTGPQCGFQVEDNNGSRSGSRCVPALRDQQAGRQQRDGEIFLKAVSKKDKNKEREKRVVKFILVLST